MSLKLIELQVALPRTYDAGKIQEQMQQRSQNGQHFLSTEATKEQELERSKVNENENSEKNKLDEKNGSSNQGNSTYKRRKTEKEKEEEEEVLMAAHPYKGAFLDIEG